MYTTIMIKPYLTVLAVTLVFDALWLGLVAKQFYAKYLGYLMAPSVQWWAAALFYALFAVGVTYFVVMPLSGIPAVSALKVFAVGALFGLVAYATYDLTSQALIREWPLIVTVVDLAWGAVLTGAVSTVAWWFVRIGR